MRICTVTLAAIAAVTASLAALVPLAVLGLDEGLTPGARAGAGAASILCVFSAALFYCVYRSAIRPLAAVLKDFDPTAPDAGEGRTLHGLLTRIRSIAARHAAVSGVTEAALFELDPDGTIEYANRHALRMLGAGLEGIRGRALAEFVEPGSRSAFGSILEGLPEDSPRGFTTTLVSGSGESVPVRVRARTISSGPVAAGLVVAAEETSAVARLATELERTRKEAESTSERLIRTISDLEEFALLAVRRELKMREIRERLAELSEEGHGPRRGAAEKRLSPPGGRI